MQMNESEILKRFNKRKISDKVERIIQLIFKEGNFQREMRNYFPIKLETFYAFRLL